MRATTAIGETAGAPSDCWCCGMTQPSEAMVHLGNHPEVVLCLACAHFVHKEAWEIEDRARTGPGVRARGWLRRLRRGVVERGWHNSPVIGRAVRWLGKYVP